MATRLINRFLTDTLDFDENDTVIYKLPRDRAIRRITAWVTIKVNAAATAPTGLKKNHYLSLLKKIKLMRNGSDAKITTDGPTKFIADTYEMGVEPYATASGTPAASGSFTYQVALVFDFAQVRANLSDFTALINARRLSSLEFIVQWGAIKDIFGTVNGATVDTDATKIEFSLDEVFDNQQPRRDGDPGLDSYLDNAIDIREQIETEVEIDQARDSFDLDEQSISVRPIPANVWFELIRARKNITDGDPEDSDDVITHIKYQNIKGGTESIFLDTWISAIATLKQDNGLDTAIKGGLFINWLRQRQGGLRNLEPDALKIKLLTKAPASGKKNGVLIWRKYVAGPSGNVA